MPENPIKRIYIEGSSTRQEVCIEIELPREFEIGYQKTKKLTLKTGACTEKDQIDVFFDMICKMFGITIQKSDLVPVTFVNMFCSDKDAKLSDIPQPVPKPYKGVLL